MSADKGGRPSTYKPTFAEQARKLCELGATDIEIADFFEVSDRTVYRWQLKYPEFCQALKAGKDAADDRVERALYHKATGYTFESEKIFQYEGEIVRTATREHVPPDTTSMIFWLKNRRPAEWRDKTNHELTGASGGPIEITDADRVRAVAALMARAGTKKEA